MDGRTDHADILEIADLLRVPAANVGTGATIPHLEHLAERHASKPTSPVASCSLRYRGGSTAWIAQRGTAPTLGGGEFPTGRRAPNPKRAIPFDGLRVADFTANWAGPISGHLLAMLGAEVIHVEGGKRPDPIRNNTSKPMSDPDWPEFSGIFAGSNTGKRSVTVDMSTDAGRELARRLVATCDVVIENYSPHVMESWGLGWEQVHRSIRARSWCGCLPTGSTDRGGIVAGTPRRWR